MDPRKEPPGAPKSTFELHRDGTESVVIDLTLDGDSNSEVDDTFNSTTDENEKPPSLTLTSNQTAYTISNKPIPITKADETHNSDEDNNIVKGVLLAQARKRKRQSQDDNKPRPRPAIPPKPFDSSAFRDFLGSNLETVTHNFSKIPHGFWAANRSSDSFDPQQNLISDSNTKENTRTTKRSVNTSIFLNVDPNELKRRKRSKKQIHQEDGSQNEPITHERKRSNNCTEHTSKVSISEENSDRMKTPQRIISTLCERPHKIQESHTDKCERTAAPGASNVNIADFGSQRCNSSSTLLASRNPPPAHSSTHLPLVEKGPTKAPEADAGSFEYARTDSIFDGTPRAEISLANGTTTPDIVPKNNQSTRNIEKGRKINKRSDADQTSAFVRPQKALATVAGNEDVASNTSSRGHQRHNIPLPSDNNTDPSSSALNRNPGCNQPLNPATQPARQTTSGISSNIQPCNLQGYLGDKPRPEKQPEYAKPPENKWERLVRMNHKARQKAAREVMKRPICPKIPQKQSQSTSIGVSSERPHQSQNVYRNTLHEKSLDQRQGQRQPRLAMGDASPKRTAPDEARLLTAQSPLTVTKGSQAYTNIRSEAGLRKGNLTEVEQQGRRHGNEASPARRNRPSQGVTKTVYLPQEPSRSDARASNLGKEDYLTAAAQFQALMAEHEQKRKTMLIDALPDNFANPSHQSRARAVKNIGTRARNATRYVKDRAVQRKRRITRDVNKDHAHEPEEFRANLIEEKFNKYLENRKKAEINKQQREKDKGLPTVECLKDDEEIFNGEEANLAMAQRIPATQVVGTSDTIVIYVVYLSKPFEDGTGFEDCLMRTKTFGRLESANFYAKQLLEGGKPTLSQHPKKAGLRIVSLNFWYSNDLLYGQSKRGDGKNIFCQVRKEQQVVGDMDPDILRNKWVSQELVEVYRKRWDVFLVNVVPKAFLEQDKRSKEEKNKQERERERERKESSIAANGEQEEAEVETALEGDALRAALANLPAPDSSPILNADKDHDNDTCSEASENSSVVSSSTERHRSPSLPFRGDPERYPGTNPWAHEEYQVMHIGSYTDRRLANEQALDVARIVWSPQVPNMDAIDFYHGRVMETIRTEREDMDMDVECADITFLVPPYQGHKDRRPWPFVHSRVLVQETRLEGPRNLGVNFVLDCEEAYDVSKAVSAAKKAAATVSMDQPMEEEEEEGGIREDMDG